jgi:hypothetical protein
MRMPLVSRVLFCLVSVYLVVGAHIADYSRTHLPDPRWTPHANSTTVRHSCSLSFSRHSLCSSQ